MAGKIRGITIEIGADTSKFASAIRQLNTQVRSTASQLRDVDKLLKFKPGNTELLAQKQKVLANEITATKAKLTELKNAEATMKANGVDENSEQFMALRREIISTEEQLKTLEREYANFGSVAAQKVAAVGAKMQELGRKMSAVGSQLTQKVTLPLTIVGTVGVKKFAEVDKVMQLTNKTMSNTADEAQMLDQAMKDAAANSTFGMNDAATATLNFARAGLDAGQAAAALAPAMNLAAGEGGNLDTVSAGLVATINGFQGSFEEAADYADIFANACNNSALDIDSLSSSMSVAAPVFNAAGYSVKDAALYMGVMANAGIEASEGANALKTGLSRLISPAKEGQEWMDKLGISVTEADGSMKSSVQIQQELNAAFSELSESEQIAAASAIFGKNQMSKWLALINTAPGDVQELSTALEKEGTTQEMATAMMSGFGGSLEKLKSSVDVAATSLGQALAPTISKIADVVQRATDWFNGLSDSQREMIAKIGLAVAALGPMLVIFGKLTSGIGGILKTAPKIVKTIRTVSNGIKLLSASAFGPWVLIIGAAIAAGILLYKNWDKIKAFAQKLAAALKAAFDSIKAAIVNAWNNVKTMTVNTWNAISTAVSNAVSTVKTAIANAWNAIKTTTANVWNGIKTTISTAITNARTTVSNIANSIKTALSNAWNGAKSAASSAFNSIKTAITSPIESARATLSGIVDKIKGFFPIKLGNIFSGVKLPHFRIDGGEVPWGIGGQGRKPTVSIDWYRKAMQNAYVLDGASIFGAMNGRLLGGGESGREIIVSYDKLAQMIGGGTTNVNIVVNASPGMNESLLADVVARKLQHTLNSRRAVWGN